MQERKNFIIGLLTIFIITTYSFSQVTMEIRNVDTAAGTLDIYMTNPSGCSSCDDPLYNTQPLCKINGNNNLGGTWTHSTAITDAAVCSGACTNSLGGDVSQYKNSAACKQVNANTENGLCSDATKTSKSSCTNAVATWEQNTWTASTLNGVWFSGELGGFNFELSGINITGTSGGSADAAGFTVSQTGTSGSTGVSKVVAFTLTGDAIPAGEGILTQITFTAYDDTGICFGTGLTCGDQTATVEEINRGSVISDQHNGCVNAVWGTCHCSTGVDVGCGCGEAAPSGCDLECGSTKVDDCDGECGGTKVDDCAGTCNGSATADCAGTCNGTVVVDCAGTCGGTVADDTCGVCGGSGPPTNYNCADECTATVDCNGACGGAAVVDACGTCGGSVTDASLCACTGGAVMDCAGACGGTAVVDCAGVCGGTKVDDTCGVCDGSGPPANYNCFGHCSTLPDCAGVCGGTKVVDACGTCDGSVTDATLCACTGGAVRDCAGACGGAAVEDDCGVCAGTGAPENYNCSGECTVGADCAGACGGTAVEDACGACGGTGPPTNYNCAGQCIATIDCKGACGGTAVIDVCGTCDGGITDTTACECPVSGEVKDCAGECGGTAVLSGCDNACNSTKVADCADECGGAAVDTDLDGVCDVDDNCAGTTTSVVVDADGCSTDQLSIYQMGGAIPNTFAISQNFPNPFNPVTSITFDIAEIDEISLIVYDLAGKEIATLASGIYTPGRYIVKWNALNNIGDGIVSGMYIYRYTTSEKAIIRKMLYLK